MVVQTYIGILVSPRIYVEKVLDISRISTITPGYLGGKPDRFYAIWKELL